MDSTRQQKISRLIQKELSEMFLLQTKLTKGLLVTVSGVKISSDLSIASVYLSIFPSERGEETVRNINSNVKEIRYDLGQRVRYQLRIIPELRFFLDNTLDYMARIDELLKQ
ncbi:MAG: 30S ribosome-binding factor RbfA [Bacteroidaceae bacterium]|nr:30S ribosome-binding factor RbfA [Bacteroidaceae bacterium]MBO7588510.1 30S ribosome-binding factor RbfA [Bacteroidaceae bacterium]MBP5647636.1 30S ribosome-binding factor RbfA [Bacteroidaceae bacterium]